MSVFEPSDLKALTKFQSCESQLGLVKRNPLDGSNEFFSELMQTTFSVVGQVFKESSLEDIKFILEEDISSNLQSNPFFELWVADMADICNIFCDMVAETLLVFVWVRNVAAAVIIIDNVPMRLLVTYAVEVRNGF